MRKYLLLLLSSLVLVGCATTGTFDGERPHKVGSETRLVTLIRSADASDKCAAHKPAPPGWRVIACAEFNDTICRIYMKPDASDDTLGHEARHCFDGSWHK